jgi:phage baseplate assembly protein W
MSDQGFVGYGFAYPMGVDDQGGMAMVTGAANIERSIRLIIGTAYGERPMRPEFGCGIHDLIFDLASPELISQIQLQVQASLRRWETRAEIVSVTAAFGDDPTLVQIQVTYRIKGSYDPRNLLVPFYVIPHEEES